MPSIKKLSVSLLLCFASLASGAALAETGQSSNPTMGTAEFVYKYLVAEIAGQRGDPKLAGEILFELAKQTRDVRIAERAARYGATARQQGLAMQASKLWAELDPNSAEAQQAASQLLVASGNLTEAKSHIKKLLEKQDTRANGFLYLNGLLANQKDKNEVLSAIQEFAQPYPGLPEAHFAIAQAAAVASKTDLAKKEIIAAEKLRPGWEMGAQLHGQIMMQESPAAATAFYQEFLSKHPDANEIRLTYAKLLVAQKRHAEAKSEFVKLIDSSNNNPDIAAVVGLLSLEVNDLESADNYMTQAIDHGYKDPEQLYIYLGRSAERAKNDTKALAYYDKIKDGSHLLEGRFSAANITARTKGVDAAIRMLDEVNALTVEQQTAVIQTEANMLAQVKRNQEAFDLMDKAVHNLPNSPELVYDYAMAAERLQKYEVMESELRKVIKMKPDSAAAYNALGYSLADRNLNLKEARSLIETAIKLSPNDHYILDSLGWVQYRLGNLAQAAEYLGKAYAIQADPEIAAHLGEVLWKQGLQAEAQKIWADALSANPDNEVLSSTAKRFNS